jgi:hypothetical protein
MQIRMNEARHSGRDSFRRNYVRSLNLWLLPVILSALGTTAAIRAATTTPLETKYHLRRLRSSKGSDVSNTESLVVVKLDHNGGQAPLVFEVLEQAGLLDEVSEHGVEMVEPGAVGFRIPRGRMDAVVLALACGGFANVRAYDVQDGRDTAG